MRLEQLLPLLQNRFAELLPTINLVLIERYKILSKLTEASDPDEAMGIFADAEKNRAAAKSTIASLLLPKVYG